MKQNINELKELVSRKGEAALREIEVFDMSVEVVSKLTNKVIDEDDLDRRAYPQMPCVVRGTLTRVEIVGIDGNSLTCTRRPSSGERGSSQRISTSTSFLQDRQECEAELNEIRDQYIDDLKLSITQLRQTAQAVGPGWKMNLVSELDDFLASVTNDPEAFVSTEMVDPSMKKQVAKKMVPSM